MNSTNSSIVFKLSKWDIFLNRTSAQIMMETCAFVLIGLTAIGGNLLVVASIYRNRALRTCTNYLVLSLSITDILYPLTVLPLTILWLITIKTNDFDYSQDVSVYTLALMAFNRYFCVCKAERYKHTFKKKRTLLMVGALWIVAFTVSILLVKGDLSYARFWPSTTTCFISRMTKNRTTKIQGNLLLTVAIALPYVIILFCYIKIFLKIRQHKKAIAQGPCTAQPSSSGNALGAQEIKITWTLFAVLLGYLVTWVPVLVTGIVLSYDKSVPHYVSIIISMGVASSSAVNPMIYGAMNPAFRREYIKILRFIASFRCRCFLRSHHASVAIAMTSQSSSTRVHSRRRVSIV